MEHKSTIMNYLKNANSKGLRTITMGMYSSTTEESIFNCLHSLQIFHHHLSELCDSSISYFLTAMAAMSTLIQLNPLVVASEYCVSVKFNIISTLCES
jgi:hypothetical protein